MPEAFNPDVEETKFDIDKSPSEMTPEEKLTAAKHGLYEAYRQMTTLKATTDYLAELVGVGEDEIVAIGQQAELDEYRDQGMDPDDDESDYEVADSYEDAAAGRTRTSRGEVMRGREVLGCGIVVSLEMGNE